MNPHITSRFIKSNEQLTSLNIVGILLGGSVIYKHDELNTLDAATDWDGLVLVERKVDIVNLVNQHRSKLCALFDISVEECPTLHLPEIDDGVRFEAFDAVRFAGTSPQSIKKSLKILSVEHLNTIFAQCDRKGRINILSSKDVRVAGSQTQSKRYRRRIRQATRLHENLFILHDMDIFLSERCKTHGICAAMFGVATDLLMSGCWIYQDARKIGDLISMKLFVKLNQIHSTPFLLGSSLTHIFAKHSDFQPKYTKRLHEKLVWYQNNINKNLASSSTFECDNECAINIDFFWGNIPELIKIIEEPILRNGNMEQFEKLTFDFNTMDLKPRFSIFSADSTHGDFSTLDTVEKIFWKKTDYWKQEVQAVPFVAQFYKRTQRPQKIDYDNGVILYPFFSEDTLAMIRLEHAKQELAINLQHNYEKENMILTIELQRAEDMLCAYCKSAKMPSNRDECFPSIHRLFYERLVNNKCINEFYENGIGLPYEFASVRHLTLEQLLSKCLNVNGKQYGSLKKILEKAEELLRPSSFIDQLVIFGLGNGHSGNVLVSNIIQPNSTRNILYTDYEVAGYHSPILDLAKYFYYDVFFNIFYAHDVTSDDLFVRNIIQLSFHDGDILTIKLNMPESMLSKAILEIKRRYMLVPFLEFIEKTEGKLKLFSNWPSIFGHALFCCALLTRNFSERPDVFFANLALGVILTGMNEISTAGHFIGLEGINL